jgi:hypothetical protein
MSECFVQSVQGKGSGKNFMQFLELIAWKVCHLNPNLGFAKNTSLMSEAAVWWDLQNLWIREGSEWTRLQRWAVIINIMLVWGSVLVSVEQHEGSLADCTEEEHTSHGFLHTETEVKNTCSYSLIQ